MHISAEDKSRREDHLRAGYASRRPLRIQPIEEDWLDQDQPKRGISAIQVIALYLVAVIAVIVVWVAVL
ncbi:hypothetical protein [Sphingomonas sp.]|jgi:hypothetical protein|uniref:hypothetical protein n=1 Tax=Sphingomonas sp. TaxID=28214 RepID=UPI003566FD25